MIKVIRDSKEELIESLSEKLNEIGFKVLDKSQDYEKDMSILIGRVRSYHINQLDISNEYDLDNDFEKFKVDDIFLKYTTNNDAISFKINLLQKFA